MADDLRLTDDERRLLGLTVKEPAKKENMLASMLKEPKKKKPPKKKKKKKGLFDTFREAIRSRTELGER